MSNGRVLKLFGMIFDKLYTICYPMHLYVCESEECCKIHALCKSYESYEQIREKTERNRKKLNEIERKLNQTE